LVSPFTYRYSYRRCHPLVDVCAMKTAVPRHTTWRDHVGSLCRRRRPSKSEMCCTINDVCCCRGLLGHCAEHLQRTACLRSTIDSLPVGGMLHCSRQCMGAATKKITCFSGLKFENRIIIHVANLVTHILHIVN
jgi:hypothetical protein